MERIDSFNVDHRYLKPGIYLSRQDKIGNTILNTFDLRFKRPNYGDYIDGAASHTIEHLVATYLRNSAFKERVVYFGPMGCATGFYLITDDSVRFDYLISELYDAFMFVADYAGEIPGVSLEECGNYQYHDLEKAKEEARKYAEVLKNKKELDLYVYA